MASLSLSLASATRAGLLACILVFTVGGCSSADTSGAERETTRFHSRLDEGQFEAIWAATGPELRQATPKPQFLEFLAAVRKKLGKVKAAKLSGWRVHYGTGGNRIELAYDTEFERGTAAEQFVFSTGEPPKLLGYHVNSPTLVLN